MPTPAPKRPPLHRPPEPAAGPKVVISKSQVLEALRQQKQLAALAKELKQLQTAYIVTEAGLITLMKAKVPFEAGCPPCAIQVERGKRSVKWREAFEERLGKDAAEALVNKTEPGPDKEHLVINEL